MCQVENLLKFQPTPAINDLAEVYSLHLNMSYLASCQWQLLSHRGINLNTTSPQSSRYLAQPRICFAAMAQAILQFALDSGSTNSCQLYWMISWRRYLDLRRNQEINFVTCSTHYAQLPYLCQIHFAAVHPCNYWLHQSAKSHRSELFSYCYLGWSRIENYLTPSQCIWTSFSRDY